VFDLMVWSGGLSEPLRVGGQVLVTRVGTAPVRGRIETISSDAAVVAHVDGITASVPLDALAPASLVRSCRILWCTFLSLTMIFSFRFSL
jgi:hypothetical protein